MKYPILLFLCLFYSQTKSFAQCQPVLLKITTQEQIDNFSTQYPGCTRVDGGFEISGPDITNLEGLSQIEIILGHLRITNTSITSFQGLHNVDSIYSNVEIVTNNLITNFAGLESLTYIHGYLVIFGNEALINLEGSNSLDRIRIRLIIEENAQLQTLSGLNSLEYIGENFWVSNNPSLINFEGLNNLDTVGNYFLISNNGIVNLNGLDSLRVVENNLTVVNNPNLVSFEGIKSLEYVQILSILQNPVLQNLSGLGSFLEIDDDIDIVGNPMLTTLSGLEIQDPLSTINFSVSENTSLSDCATPTICEFLETRFLSVFGNATGCNNNDEIQAQCMVAVDDVNLSVIEIYPNPVESFLYFSEPSTQSKATITDMSGQVILSNKNFTGRMDVSFLKPGVYILSFGDTNRYQSLRLVKY